MIERLLLNGSDWLFLDYLDEAWRGKKVEADEPADVRPWRKGTVPGSVHQDLWDNGVVPSPYVEQNSLQLEWIPQRSWAYRKTFPIGEEMRGRRAQLHLRGIDYSAHIFLNGSLLGTHESMFTPAVYEVAGLLRYGADNILTVVLDPAPDNESQMGLTSKVQSTKTRMNYWWDFAPRMVHLGIWQEVYVEFTGSVRIEDVFVRSQLCEDFTRAEVSVAMGLSSEVALAADIRMELFQEGHRVAEAGITRHHVEIGTSELHVSVPLEAPKLWWPNGEGDQPLYELKVNVTESGTDTVSHERNVVFGIRKLEMSYNDTASPEALPYTFTVNGRKVYAKGWNWVPIDVLYGVERHAKLEHLLTLAKKANVNLIRINAVGLIETDAFYDLCSRLGIMVWQEFNLTSSANNSKPKEDAEFISRVVKEAEVFIPLKRNHASLMLWCGGNELESLEKLPLNDGEPVIAALRETVKRLDPDKLWLPCSPSGPLPFNGINMSRNRPQDLHDVHGPWHHEGLTQQYTLFNAGANLFHSEFGADGITNRKALEAAVKPENRWPVTLQNPVWYHLGSWWVQEQQWQEVFGELPDLDTAIEVTQYLQAEGVRYVIERNRARKFRNSGVLPWMFNEPYPMAACTSAVDYFGRPKHQYYAVAEAYHPASVTAKFAKQAGWGREEQFSAEIWVVNGTVGSYEGAVLRWSIAGMDGTVYAEGHIAQHIQANEAASFGFCSLEMSGLQGAKLFFLSLKLESADGRELGRNRYLFSAADHLMPMLELGQVQLDVEAEREGNESTLTIANTGAEAALLVRIDDDRPLASQGFVYISRSGFHLLPGESCTAAVEWHGAPEAERRLTVRALNAAVQTIVQT